MPIKGFNESSKMKRILPQMVIKRHDIIKRAVDIKIQQHDKPGVEMNKGVALINTFTDEQLSTMHPNFDFDIPQPDKKRLYIIGGGNSVLHCNLNELQDGDIMAVNRAIEYVNNPTYFITMDYTFIRDKVNLKLLEKAKYKIFVLNTSAAIAEHKGVYYDARFGMVYQRMNLFNRVYKSKYVIAPETGFALKEEDFAHGENSGFSALQTGLLLGYKEIVLIGFDLGITGKTHFHGGYGQNPGAFAKNLTRYIAHYETAFRMLPSIHRERIFNASSSSVINKYVTAINPKFIKNELTVTDNKPVKEFYGRVKPNLEKEVEYNEVEMGNNTLDDLMVVGYYTTNTPYEEEAKKTIASCERLKLNHDIIGIPNFGSWQANTRYKAKFMLDMLNKHKGKRLLYIDCDAIINELPVLFKNYSADIAVRWQDFRWRQNECLSGTIYMENNERTVKLCKMWLDINDTQGNNTKIFEQWNLGTAIETMKATDGLIAKNLPPEYCQFDLIEKIYPQLKKGAGIIQHYQRSRIYRNKI